MAPSELEYDGTEFEPESELEIDSEDESEPRSEEGPRLTGVMLHPSTQGMSRHDIPSFVSQAKSE